MYGHEFTVLTDNNLLTYVSTTARLDAAEHSWLAALSTYDFDILYYRSGKQNQDADDLSRKPHTYDDFQSTSICRDSIKAVCQAVHASPLIISFSLDATVLDDNMPAQNVIDQEIDWQHEQSSDPTLKIWIHYVPRKGKPRLEDLPFGFISQS